MTTTVKEKGQDHCGVCKRRLEWVEYLSPAHPQPIGQWECTYCHIGYGLEYVLTPSGWEPWK